MSYAVSRRAFLLSLLFVVMFSVAPEQSQATEIIQTIAGGGSLEGYKPLEANLALGGSEGLAIDPLGNVVISDSGHNQVLMISQATGLLTVVAGDGTASYFGDGLPAPSAGLNNPGGLAFDSKGNLFIVDKGNFVVRRVDALSNEISTVAGDGLFTGQIVGTNPPAPLGDGGAATSATFASMGGIAIDSTGAILVGDIGNNCVRKFTIGSTIATIAGTAGKRGFAGDGGAATAALFSSPTGIVVDASGNIFISDSGNRRVRKVDGSGTVTTFAGSGSGGSSGFSGDGGLATAAQIGSLGGLAFNKANELLITCVGANCIRKVDASGNILTIAGNGALTLGDLGPATGATLSAPHDVGVDKSGNIFIYDSGNGRIRRVDATTGFIDTIIGTGLRGLIGDRGPFQQGVLVGPNGAAYDANGNLYIADSGDNAVRMVAPSGIITTIAGTGDNNFLGDGGPATEAALSFPQDVTVVGTTLFIADTGNNKIRAVDLTKGIITSLSSVNAPVAMVAKDANNIFVATGNQVDLITSNGNDTHFAGSSPINTVANPNGDGLPAINASFSGPSGLALDANGNLFIADTGNNQIRMISAAGITSTVAGTGTSGFSGDGAAATLATLNSPAGVTLDSAGNLVVADTGNQRIRQIDSSTQTIHTIVGDGTAGFKGDGDVIASAEVNFPGKLFLNAGSLVICDVGNNRIREIVSAIDISPKVLSFAAKLTFAIDKKTQQEAQGKDSVALKAGLALPAGISTKNLIIRVDIADLHQQIQLDANGKQPKAVKAPKATKGSKTSPTVFGFTLPSGGVAPVSKFTLSIKGGTSTAGGNVTPFGFASKGTFRDQLGRAGFTNTTTAKGGVALPLRINITLGNTVFSGLITVQYSATQGKGGSAKSVKVK